MLLDVPVYFTEEDIPEVFKIVHEIDLQIQKLFCVKFVDGGKEIRYPITTEEDN